MATIADVAEKAGVSATTVSRVLNENSLVNTETRKTVLQAIEELNYIPSVFARGLRGQKTKTIGVLIPDFRSYWYSEVLRYLEAEVRRRGYLATICSIGRDPERETEYIDDLLRRQVDGTILCIYKESEQKKKYLKKVLKKIPFVIMDSPVSGLPVSVVYTDGYKGISLITRAFIKQGHKNIGMLANDLEYEVHHARLQGYLDTLEEMNMKKNEKLIKEIDVGFKAGYEGAKDLLSDYSPTAIVTMDDLTAVGTIRYCHEQGIRVPDDISVTGFDDIAPARFSTPTLTTVAQPVKDLAEKSVELIINKIENKKSRNKEVVFEPKIVLRESTTLTAEDLQ